MTLLIDIVSGNNFLKCQVFLSFHKPQEFSTNISSHHLSLHSSTLHDKIRILEAFIQEWGKTNAKKKIILHQVINSL